jgi:hypothetical protein
MIPFHNIPRTSVHLHLVFFAEDVLNLLLGCLDFGKPTQHFILTGTIVKLLVEDGLLENPLGMAQRLPTIKEILAFKTECFHFENFSLSRTLNTDNAC